MVELQGLLDRQFVYALHRVFRRDPFQIGLPLSYLFLKEIEVKSLESLLSALSRARTGAPGGVGHPAGKGTRSCSSLKSS